MHTDRWLDVLFGMGDDDFPFWLMAVRINILLFLACSLILALWKARRAGSSSNWSRGEIVGVGAITLLAGALRLASGPNLFDFGGIPYSRLLLGYKGHFATAQFYSLLYELTARDIEHAIHFNRIAGVLTVPLVYLLCRHFERSAFPFVAAGLFALYPLHVVFSASDVLPIFSLFLTAWSYVLLLGAERESEQKRRMLHYLGGFAGLALLTQVRYENALFALPAVGLLVARRRELAPTSLLPGLLIAGLLVVAYGIWTISAGLSFQNPVRLDAGSEMVLEHVVLNPMIAVPVLMVANLLGCRFGGMWFAMASAAAWAAALALPIAAESGHGAARVFASWLIPILPLAAYGPARLLGASDMPSRAVAAWFIAIWIALPIGSYHRLTAQHLEILEHDFYRAQLEVMPSTVKRLIVPDDELLRRRTRSTIELENKYAFTLAGLADVGERLELVKLTRYLENREEPLCEPGECAFFAGLPCFQQNVYPYSREQCDELSARARTKVLAQREVVAAPFMNCSIYVGAQYDRYCAPALRSQRFAVYSIE